jgi:hypothetical protein
VSPCEGAEALNCVQVLRRSHLSHWMDDGRWTKSRAPVILCYTPPSEPFWIIPFISCEKLGIAKLYTALPNYSNPLVIHISSAW